MLGLTGDTAQLPQPMTAFVEREGNLLRFFSLAVGLDRERR